MPRRVLPFVRRPAVTVKNTGVTDSLSIDWSQVDPKILAGPPMVLPHRPVTTGADPCAPYYLLIRLAHGEQSRTFELFSIGKRGWCQAIVCLNDVPHRGSLPTTVAQTIQARAEFEREIAALRADGWTETPATPTRATV